MVRYTSLTHPTKQTMIEPPAEYDTTWKEALGQYFEPFLEMELMAKEEGREEGALQIARESVLAVLQVRFETVPPELVEVINNIADIPRLKQLLLQAIAIPSLAEFQQRLATASDASDTGETNTATDSN
jgi:hypothetical protein